jgi:hypothetical protein
MSPMKTATLNLFGTDYKVRIETDTYQSGGGIAVSAIDAQSGEPFCSISVNLPESVLLPDGAFYAKHWSENEGLVEQLVAQGVLVPVDAPVVASGFVDNIQAYRLA